MADTLQIVVFYLGTECFGLDIKGVNWVITEKGTKAGLKASSQTVTLNNEIIPIFNLHNKLHIKPLKENNGCFLILSDSGGKFIAIKVDRLEKSCLIPFECINPIPFIFKNPNMQYLDRIVNLKDRLILVISIEWLFQAIG